MRVTRKLGISMLIACLMVVSGVIPMSLVAGNAAAFGSAHAAIHIDGNADFATQAGLEGWTGDGSSGNPYIIADYDIDTSAEVGITIANTDVYFVISSVDLAMSFAYAYNGMELTNVSNGLITGVVSQGNVIGVSLTSCSNMVIQGGALEPYYFGMSDFTSNAYIGLLVQYCNNVDIMDVVNVDDVSYFVYNTFGIYVTDSTDVSISNCNMVMTYDAICVNACTGVTIDGVTAQWNGWNGIDVRNSNDVQITDTITTNNGYNGIYLFNDTTVSVSGTDATPSTLYSHYNGYHGLSAFYCTDLTVSGGEFFSNVRSGVDLEICTNPQILNAQASANGAFWGGITLRYCKNATLINDRSNGNLLSSSGYQLEDCDGVLVSNCVATSNEGNGMYVKGGKNIDIDTDTFASNYGSGVYCSRIQNLTLSGIDSSSNSNNGLFLLSMTAPTTVTGVTSDGNGWNGVHLVAVPNAAITGGSMSTNSWNGIYLKGSSSVTIDSPTADYNGFTGIYAAICTDLLISGSTSTSYNLRDGIFVGVCTNPIITNVISTGNSWWGLRALGCTMVSVVSSDLTGNVFGETYWPNSPPVALFSVKRIAMITGPTEFDASASIDLDGTIVEYKWDFGDGSIVSVGTSTTTHQYATMDNYVVKLSVKDDNGTWSTECIRDTSIQTNISAKIVMPDKSTVGTVVDLSAIGVSTEVCKDGDGNPVYRTLGASYTTDPLRTIDAYEWDFDDGSLLESDPEVTHSWAAPGSYDVALRVQDDQGRWSPVSTSRIYISVAGVAALSLELARHSLFPGETTTLDISAVDGAGNLVSGCTSTVEVSGNGTGWTGLPATVSLIGGKASIVVSCTEKTNHNITAYIQGDPSTTWYEHATVADRTVEITVYDLGQKQLGNVDDVYITGNISRSQWANDVHQLDYGDYPLRYGGMAYHLYSTGSKLESNIDTTDRVHAEARNMSDINMASSTFFPRMQTGPGGNLSFTWNWHYLNLSEYWWWNTNKNFWDPSMPQNPYTFSTYDQETLGTPSQFSLYSSLYDGWETWQDISITMDMDAAWQLIGMPNINFTTDPMEWWTVWDWDTYLGPGTGTGNNNQSVMYQWTEGFMVDEGGSPSKTGRLDICSADDGWSWAFGLYGQIYYLEDNLDGTITLTINRIGYGEDVLLARWLHWGGVSNGWNYPNGTPGGIIPWEPYYDDFYLSGSIDSQSADITLDAANIYAWRAQKSADPNVPANTAAWRWEQIRIDYDFAADASTNRSEMELWNTPGATFDCWDPAGISWPKIGYPADQSPNIIYLDVGESLIIERPRTVVSGIAPVGFVGIPTLTEDRTGSGYLNWIQVNEKWGNATIHPLGCYPGTSVVDKGTGDLTIVGPFVPIIDYYSTPGLTWLWKNSAPLIEYWIQ